MHTQDASNNRFFALCHHPRAADLILSVSRMVRYCNRTLPSKKAPKPPAFYDWKSPRSNEWGLLVVMAYEGKISEEETFGSR